MRQQSIQLDRFLSTPEVQEITGWSKTTLWRQWKASRFPAPIPTAPQRVGWLESEVAEWQEQIVANRDEQKQRRDQPKPKRSSMARKASSRGKQTMH